MLPNFIVIGAQKSASTYLQFCLDDHPEIYMPAGEVPYFESPDYENNNISDLEHYFHGRSELCLGIKRPNYIGKPEVPGRIKDILPNAKLIAVLRNPVDRAVSAYFHLIKYGFLPALSVEDGMRRIILTDSFSEKFKRAPEIIEFGLYSKYLSKYQYFFENDRILTLLHEDILRNPIGEVQRVYKFLGVNDDLIPKSIGLRPQKVIYSINRLKLLSRRNKYLFEYNEDITRCEQKKMSPLSFLAAGSITAFDRYLLSRIYKSNKPQISEELKQILNDIYKDDILNLETLIDKDLKNWMI
ncbi:MAG: sulfotransferase [Pseudomonadota bacterium]